MSVLFLLPGLGYGLFLGLTQGVWHLMFLSLATAIVWLVARSRKPVNPAGEIEISQSGVAVDGRRLHNFSYFWNRQLQLRIVSLLDRERPEVMLERLFDSGLELMAGVDNDGRVIALPDSHCLIIGPTGSGKTELMRLTLENYPHRLATVDFKGGLGLANAWGSVASLTNLDENPDEFWYWLEQQLSQREQQLITGSQPEKLLIMVDELGQVLTSSQRASAAVEKITSKGRSLGVFLIAANQTLSGVSRVVLANCGVRIALVGTDSVDAMQLGAGKQSAKPIAAGWSAANYVRDGVVQVLNFPLGVSQLSRIEKLKRVGLSDAGIKNISRMGI